MSSYSPPTYFFNGIVFNNDFYNQVTSGVSLSYADSHYLKSYGANPISSATLTTFTGDLSVDSIYIKSYGVNTNTLIGNVVCNGMNSSSNNNTVVGYLAGNAMTSTSNGNTLIGVNAGATIGLNSSYNTCIGWGAGYASVPNLSNTTCIGYHASANYNNQIVLGSGIEVVYIAAGFITGSNFPVISGSTWSITNQAIGEVTVLNTAPGAATGTLPTPIGINSGGILSIKIFTGYAQTLSTPSGVFSGQYGSGTNAIKLYHNNNITLYSDGTNWNVYDPFGNFVTVYKMLAAQTINNATTTNVNYDTYVRGTLLANTGLTLATGVFTNNSGVTMNLSVAGYICYNNTMASGVISAILNHSVLGNIYVIGNILESSGF